MNIGYVLGRFPTLSETFVLNEIVELVGRGHKVHIFSIFNPMENIVQSEVNEYNLLEKTYYPPSYFKLGLELLKFDSLFFYKNQKRIDKFYYIAVARYFSKIIEKLDLDILHAHFAKEPAFTAMLISKVTGVPFTFTAHAIDIFVNPDVKALRERMDNASRVVTESHFHKKYLRNLTGIDEKKIEVVHICPFLEKVNKIRKEHRKKENEEWTNLITVARLVEKKGIEYAILAVNEIVSEFPNLQYAIIGDGPLKNNLKKLITKLKLESNINLVGALDNTSALEKVINSEIFILPCIKAKNDDMDGTPTALMEAMALEKTVVSTNISGIPELIENGKEGILAEPRNTEQLIKIIKILLEDEDLKVKMGENGRKKIENEFNIHKQIEKLLKIWSEV